MPQIKVNNSEFKVDKIPGTCSMCNYHIVPHIVEGRTADNSYNLQLIFQCVRPECRNLFIGYYKGKYEPQGAKYELVVCQPQSFDKRVFHDDINNISKKFHEIYNEANYALSLGLNHICGPGFRKALEFLIKDYLIYLHPDKEAEIKILFLGKCINEMVSDQNIKICAERAVWLGNDETHYTKQWIDKDITHMKELIELTLHWIQSDLITKKYLSEMPGRT